MNSSYLTYLFGVVKQIGKYKSRSRITSAMLSGAEDPVGLSSDISAMSMSDSDDEFDRDPPSDRGVEIDILTRSGRSAKIGMLM